MPSTPKEIYIPEKDLKLHTPFSMIISGPTASGKSKMLFEVLDNITNNTNPPIEKVVFIYGIWQDIYKNYRDIFFTDNLEDLQVEPEKRTLIVLDDMMSSIRDSKTLEEAFTLGVHHKKVSICLILQNLFYSGSIMKTIRDNCMYMVVTRHIQDINKLAIFGRQLEAKQNSSYFMDSYEDATAEKYSYLFIDLHPSSELRDGVYKIKYRSKVHKTSGQILYLPKNRAS